MNKLYEGIAKIIKRRISMIKKHKENIKELITLACELTDYFDEEVYWQTHDPKTDVYFKGANKNKSFDSKQFLEECGL